MKIDVTRIIISIWMVLGSAYAHSQAIPSAAFGLHYHRLSDPWPSVSFGALRLWDTGTRWAQLNPARGSYDWTRIDKWLATAKAHGITEVGYTFGSVPGWASSNPSDSACDYSRQGTGGCDLPTDLNRDGTGTNATWKAFVTALAQHVNGSAYLATHAHIGWWETWNEWDRNPVVSTAVLHSVSIRATYAQMVRMTEDLRCIITGKGSVNGTSCTAAPIDISARILTPSVGAGTANSRKVLQNFLYCNNSPITGSQCITSSRGSAAVDVINAHFYINGGAPAEQIATNARSIRAFLSGGDSWKPLWSDEGSWGNNPSLPSEISASWVARYYLVGLSSHITELYWYAYENGSYGTLFTSGGLTEAGRAYRNVYGWLSGSTIITPCAASGTQWTCGLTLSDGSLAQAIWDTSFICSNGSCTTHFVTVASTWTNYKDLAGNSFSISSHQVPVGINPILLVDNRTGVVDAPPSNLAVTVK